MNIYENGLEEYGYEPPEDEKYYNWMDDHIKSDTELTEEQVDFLMKLLKGESELREELIYVGEGDYYDPKSDVIIDEEHANSYTDIFITKEAFKAIKKARGELNEMV